MRIGIDGTCWLNRRGYGRFARALVSSLVALDGGAECTLMVDFDPAEAPAVPAGIRVLPVVTQQPAARAAAGRRSLADMWTTSRAMSRERFDLIFVPTAYTYVPVTGPSCVVVVVHDIIAERFPRQIFPTRRAAALWHLKLLAARWQADLIAGLIVDPDRPGNLCSVLRRVRTDANLRGDLRRLGPLRAAEFSWERAARDTLAAFRRITGDVRTRIATTSPEEGVIPS